MHFWRLCGRLFIFLALLAVQSSAQPGLVVSPAEVGLFVQAGSATPATATIAVTTPAPGVPIATTVLHFGGTRSWLTVTPPTANTPASLTLTATGTGLSPGTYQAQVTVCSRSSQLDPLCTGGLGRIVSVFLTVGTAGTGGGFGVSPTALTFVALEGTTVLAPQTISVTSPQGTAGFRVVPTSSGWLTVNPLSGTTPGGINVEVFPAGLPSNRYQGTVAIYPLTGGQPTIVPVTLVIAGGAVEDRLQPTQFELTYNYQTGAKDLPPQVFTVSSVFPQFFTAKTETPWLEMTSSASATRTQQLSGYTGDDTNIITAYAVPGSLSPGVYFGKITLTSESLPDVQINVTLRVTNTVALRAEPSSLVFDPTHGSPQQVNVSSTSVGLSFTAAASTMSGGNWLSVSPASGTIPAIGVRTLNISSNLSGLLPGTYEGSVLVTGLDANNLPVTTLNIPVRLIVTSVTGEAALVPDLGVDANGQPLTEITLTAQVGDINPVRVLPVTVQGAAVHPFTATATSAGGWLVVDPTSAIAPARLAVIANVSRLPGPGDYTGEIVLTSLITGAPYPIPVTLHLLDQVITVEPASVELVQPQRGEVPPAQTIRVRAPVPLRFEVLEKPEWIRLSQLFGSTPADIQVWATVSVTPPGTSGGTIRIAGPKNEVAVPVRYVAAPLTVTPESLSLRYSIGDAVVPQTLQINSGDPGRFTVQITTDTDRQWLRAEPASGTTPGTVTLTYDPLLLAPNKTYKATVTVSVSNGTTQTKAIPVELTVGSPEAAVQAVIHAATLAPTAVAPGQLITIMGTGLGLLIPEPARPTAGGVYDTRIDDTRVLFDNTPAPLLFRKNDQINAIVPYSVFGRTSTLLRVERGTPDKGVSLSLPLQLRVVESVPGIFTINGTGRGQANAVNADQTPNSVSNPAARGTGISVYLTGEGQTDPPGNDGRIILTDVRRPLLPVTARIGGLSAEVLYAGSAPMQVSGIMQVNVRIPDEAPAGVVPLEIQVGSAASQPAVTIAVR